MKNAISSIVLMVFILAMFSGCATMKTWPDNQRRAENKMVVIQEKIGDGLKTGTLSPDQSQMFLTTLKGIRTDYEALEDQEVSRDEWDKLLGRLDVLRDEINRVPGRNAGAKQPKNGERIVTLQGRIDDGRANGSVPLTEGEEFQSNLDVIRGDYSWMMKEGRYATQEERKDISLRLDSLETDINRLQ